VFCVAHQSVFADEVKRMRLVWRVAHTGQGRGELHEGFRWEKETEAYVKGYY